MSSGWIGDALGNALEGAAKGAAAGSIVPGIGTAIGAAGGLALSLAPELGKHLFGPSAGTTIAAVQQAVATVTGTADPLAQQIAVADPQVAADLRVQLAQIAADAEAAAQADVQDARKTTVALATGGSVIAWGTPVVSAVLLLAWIGSICAHYAGWADLGTDDAATLRNLAIGVAGYYIGSSSGSARKDDKLAASVPAALLPQPAAVVPTIDARPV